MRVDILHFFGGRLHAWGHDGLPRPYWRLYWNATPGWAVRCNGVEIPLGPERLLLIAPETEYRGIGHGPSDHLFLHAIGDGLLAGVRPGIHQVPCTAGLAEACGELGAASGSERGRPLAAALLLWVVTRVADRFEDTSRFSAPLAAAIALGERHLHRRIANREFARAADMHLCAFIRRFRQETGLTPQDWHQRQRISHACIALEGGYDSIDDIANAHGFCDRHHFSRVFTQLRGIAPAAYRRTSARPSAPGHPLGV